MTRYTIFNPDGNPEEENVAILCSTKREAKFSLMDGWYIIRGDWTRGDHTRDGQARTVRFIKRAINGEMGGADWYLEGREYKQNVHHWEDDDDDLDEGVRKMSFNDMVKTIRKGRRPSKMKIFGQEYPISYSSYGGNVAFQPEGYGGQYMQYQICNLREFWKNFDEGEGQDPDNMTHICYWDGTTWNSLSDNENPKRTGIRSAVISTGWGFVCYNCTPTSYEDEYGETFYDVEMN